MAEIDHCLKYTLSPRPLRKRLKNGKPYWNQQLYDLWFKMSISEKDYSSFKGHHNIREMMSSIVPILTESLEKQKESITMKSLEQISTNNPREVWAQMKRL